MHFQISRNGQVYGPYTLDDLHRYVGTGNVLPSDLAKSEEMAEWLPVSQILAMPPVPAAVPQPLSDYQPVAQAYAQPAVQTYTQPVSQTYAQPYAQPMLVNPALAASPYPDAPNLHWGLTILFSVLSCFVLFTFIWDIVIALWLRRVQPNDQSLFWYLAALGVYAVKYVFSLMFLGAIFSHGFNPAHLPSTQWGGLAIFNNLFSLVELGLIIGGNFVKRTSLLEHFNGPEPVGLQLDPVMTFFFAPWYFQYHLNRINALKLAARYGTAPAF